MRAGIATRNRGPDYDATSTELRNLIRWLFREAPAGFDGPPESERVAVTVVNRRRPHAFRADGRRLRRRPARSD
jgi:hypothetical protein